MKEVYYIAVVTNIGTVVGSVGPFDHFPKEVDLITALHLYPGLQVKIDKRYTLA